MYSGLNVLHSAIYKADGYYQRVEWKTLTQEAQQKVKQGSSCRTYWNKIFLNHLSNLVIDTDTQLIKGSLDKLIETEEREQNLKRLSGSFFNTPFWVYSTYDFDTYFILQGYSTKLDSIQAWKENDKNPDVFYSVFVQLKQL